MDYTLYNNNTPPPHLFLLPRPSLCVFFFLLSSFFFFSVLVRGDELHAMSIIKITRVIKYVDNYYLNNNNKLKLLELR